MDVLVKVREFITNLDEQKFYIYTGIFIGVITLLFSIIIYRTFSTIDELKYRIESINEYRQEAQQIMARFADVKRQRAKVNEILTQDRRFKITNYFDTLIDNLGMRQNLPNEPKVVEQDLDKQYKEVYITPALKHVNMRQFSQLLQDIEESERVYVKKIDIAKAQTRPPSIDVTITIATLQPRIGV
ncbi:MAG: hypothetical protein WD068_00340 [Candidatus Babeliales bacterium]